MPSTRGSVSGVLNRRLKEALEGPPAARHAADLAVMHGLITRGVRSRWAGMRLGSLRSRHPEEYMLLLRAERDGEPYEQPEVPEQGRAVQGSRWHRASSDLRFETQARMARSLGRGGGAASLLGNRRISSSRSSLSSHFPYLRPLRVTVPHRRHHDRHTTVTAAVAERTA